MSEFNSYLLKKQKEELLNKEKSGKTGSATVGLSDSDRMARILKGVGITDRKETVPEKKNEVPVPEKSETLTEKVVVRQPEPVAEPVPEYPFDSDAFVSDAIYDEPSVSGETVAVPGVIDGFQPLNDSENYDEPEDIDHPGDTDDREEPEASYEEARPIPEPVSPKSTVHKKPAVSDTRDTRKPADSSEGVVKKKPETRKVPSKIVNSAEETREVPSFAQIRNFPREILDMAKAQFPSAVNNTEALCAYCLYKKGLDLNSLNVDDRIKELVRQQADTQTEQAMYDSMLALQKNYQKLAEDFSKLAVKSELAMSYMIADRLSFKVNRPDQPEDIDFIDPSSVKILKKLRSQEKVFRRLENEADGRPIR